MNYFIYNVLNTALISNGATHTAQPITISAQNGFQLQEIRSTGTSKVRVLIKDTNGELFSSSAFDAGIIGAGQNKLVFNKEIIIPDKTQLEISFLNNTGSTIDANSFELQLIGFKL